MCFVHIEKAFDVVPRKVMKWAMREIVLREVIVRALMILYHGAKIKVRVGSKLSEEFLVPFGVHQGSVLLPLLFSIAVDVITEYSKEGLMKEVLYADYLILISANIEYLREVFEMEKSV